MKLLAPFPYFGGKSKIAPVVWQYLGDVEHYFEPFFGSGAVLLNRPNYNHIRHTETVCDKDGMIANVWRAIKYAPDEVAKYCDNPVDHVDLVARRKYIMERTDLVEKMIEDAEWFDAKVAGYWIWCSSCWIGSGMLEGKISAGLTQIPHISSKCAGINKPVLYLGKIPHISHKGKGINKTTLYSGATDAICDTIHNSIQTWLHMLADRLRLVRVVCGDWSRICGGNWQDANWKTVGIYFDPPYSSASRQKNLYRKDDLTVSEAVAEWALERGKKESYKIIISGYDDEECYTPLLENGWRTHKWKANIGFSATSGKDNENRHKEILYVSPYCEKTKLFEEDK